MRKFLPFENLPTSRIQVFFNATVSGARTPYFDRGPRPVSDQSPRGISKIINGRKSELLLKITANGAQVDIGLRSVFPYDRREGRDRMMLQIFIIHHEIIIGPYNLIGFHASF
jgi:hypothetical protein